MLVMPFTPPNPERTGDMIETITHTRDRYQRGSLTIEGRANGPDLWVYRWRESTGKGKTSQRKRIVGTKKEFPTESAAWRAVDGLRLDINAESINSSVMTVDELIAHYKLIELADTNSKTARTKDVHRHQLDNIISPRWGSLRLSEVKPIAVEKWLNEMKVARGQVQDEGCSERVIPARHAV
jgi:integrase